MTAPPSSTPQPIERFYLVSIVLYILLATAFGIRYLSGDQPTSTAPPPSATNRSDR